MRAGNKMVNPPSTPLILEIYTPLVYVMTTHLVSDLPYIVCPGILPCLVACLVQKAATAIMKAADITSQIISISHCGRIYTDFSI